MNLKVCCVECGSELNPDTAWHEVTGWEHYRVQGGTNHVALRKRSGKLMCQVCMMKLQSGLSATQMTL